jgi:hypothetical protein
MLLGGDPSAKSDEPILNPLISSVVDGNADPALA